MNLGIAGLEWVSTIGSGGFGVVHRARDEAHGRDVAVKILHGAADEPSRRRFDRERRLMGSVSSHPNIVSIHTSGYTESGSPYLVMELVASGSLAERIEQGPLDVVRTIEIGRRLSEALCAAHAAGVLHLDIKPENVLIGDRGVPMLTDFGIASSVSEVSLRNTISVSPAYSAPEVLNQFEVDERTDVYSLGATLYTCLTGLRPYQVGDEGVLSALGRMATDPVPRIENSTVPARLSDLIMRAMAKDPAGRPTSMQAFADELAEIDPAELSLPATESTSSPASGPTTDLSSIQLPVAAGGGHGPTAASGPARRVGLLAVAVGVIVVAILVAVILASRRTGDSAAQPFVADPTPEPTAVLDPTPPPPPTPTPTAAPFAPDDDVLFPTAFNPVWSLGRTADSFPLEPVLTAEPGEPTLCLFWEYTSVLPNSSTEARWFIDGVFSPESSVVDGTVIDGEGAWWACFDNPTGWPEGTYEVEWWVDGQGVFSEQIVVAEGLELIEVIVINDSPVDVCQVGFAPAGSGSFGLDELGQVVAPGDSVVLVMPAGRYIVRALDCNGTIRFEDIAGTVLFDQITLTVV